MDEKYLNDGIAWVRAVLEAMSTRAKTEERSLTDVESVEWDAGLAWVRDAKRQLDGINELRAISARGGAEPGEFRAEPVNVNRNPDPFDLNTIDPWDADGLRSRALTGLEKIRNLDDAKRHAAAATLVRATDPKGEIPFRVLVTGTDAYRSAFAKTIAGRSWDLNAEERQILTRAASLTGNAGGFAVPFTLDPTMILTNDGSANPFRQVCRVVQITTDEWNGVSSAGVTASWDGEAGEVSDDAPTLAQPAIPVHKAQAFVPFSIEIGMDWPNMEAQVFPMFVDAKDRLEVVAFTTGDGSSKPTGIVTELDGTSSELTETTSETFTLADVYKTLNNLAPRYRMSAMQASWMAHLATMNAIRQFDTNGGGGLWTTLGGGTPDELLGYRIYENSAMDDSSTIDAAATADNFILIIGDWSNYVIVDRIGLNVELIPHLFATGNNRPSGQRGFYAYWRVGAESVNDAAFKVMNVSTAA